MTPADLCIVALDLSLTSTGIATTHASNGEPRLSCRTVAPRRYPTATVIDHRRLHDTFTSIRTAVACDPDVVVIEWLPQFAGKGAASLRLAELHGATKHWLWAHGLTYVDVQPQQLKIYATGRGDATKEQVREQVTARYGSRLHIGTEDEADAVALLALALDSYGEPLADVPAGHRAAVSKVDWPELARPAAKTERALSGARTQHQQGAPRP